MAVGYLVKDVIRKGEPTDGNDMVGNGFKLRFLRTSKDECNLVLECVSFNPHQCTG